MAGAEPVPEQPTEPKVDTSVAHNARVWNYWLGGKDNFAADRAVGDQIAAIFPQIVTIARADRAFLGRAVTTLAAGTGIRQFLDIGTGVPTADNTHQVAQRVAPACRIVYVDNDPLVLAHARALLTSRPEGATSYVNADVRDPGAIIAAAGDTLDLSEPVAVMLLGVLNFVSDDDTAVSIVRHVMDAVPAGSHLVLTHPTLELGDRAAAESLVAFWNENATPPLTPRSGPQIMTLLDGLRPLDPGLVPCGQWRPDDGEVIDAPEYGVVAVKP